MNKLYLSGSISFRIYSFNRHIHKLIILLVFITFKYISPQSTIDTIEYYPLQIGNHWEYIYYYYEYPIFMFDTIIGDTSMPNGKTYKIMKETYSDMPGSSYYYLFRNEDTVLYMYTGDTLQCPNREYIEYNFASADSNLWPICHTSLGAEYKSCYKTFYSYQPVFNSTMETKLYYYVAIRNLDTIWSVLGTSIIWVTKNVGISSSLYEAGGYYVLYGAILNGKKYGNIVGIKDKLIEPQNYNLSQNYPNPFNPSTVISYSIPSASNVKLIVFNALGQKVKTLVSGYKNAGNYTINFNASDLPSGIYFYKLEAGQFTQAKKMIFMK